MPLISAISRAAARCAIPCPWRSPRAVALHGGCARALARSCTNNASSAEWTAAGLGVQMAGPNEFLNRLLFVQTGFGCDQHGDRSKGSTKAAMRALRDAISFNSIPGMIHAVPGGRANMLIHVKLGVPPEYPFVDLEEVAKVFPYGRLMPIEVVLGGLTFGCGRIVPELGDEDDTAIIACAAVSLGYHDKTEADQIPKAWDTRDGH